MLGLPRFPRLFLTVLLVIAIPTLYILYPTADIFESPEARVTEYEAGGIDSEHWRDPVKPNFGKEEARWGDDIDEDVLAMGQQVENGGAYRAGALEESIIEPVVDQKVVEGGVIMPKLENATAKAELGRAAWLVLHLMTLRYPDEPTPDDRETLRTFFHLFSRLYPCGECAAEFQSLLKEFPPQTSSRKVASLWLCHVHNVINLRLGKPEFDCLTLDSTYDCGCGPSASASADSAPSTTTNGTEDEAREVVPEGGRKLDSGMFGESKEAWAAAAVAR